MKFGEKLRKISNGPHEDFYIGYAFLKSFVEDPYVTYNMFLEAIRMEFKKINAFVEATDRYNAQSKEELLDYVLCNYVGFYKIFKKYDKVRCQNKKLEFYDIIKSQPFYRFYKTHAQKLNDNVKLVIFDKDGTLIDNALLFGQWTIQLLERLENVFPTLLKASPPKQTLWDHLGYDVESRIFSADSVIVKGTNDDIRNAICDYIVNIRGLVICKTKEDRAQIINMLRQEWFDISVTPGTVQECGNVRALFEFLRLQNIKIAICTSDDRKPTEEALKLLNIAVASPTRMHVNRKITLDPKRCHRREPFEIDYLVCGNDMVASKPSPDPLLKICDKLNIPPINTMMVGDTTADIHAGINARVGQTVGVLSGGYSNTNLEEATHVVRSIDDVPDIILLSKNFGGPVATTMERW